jgi:hypothetical protein
MHFLPAKKKFIQDDDTAIFARVFIFIGKDLAWLSDTIKETYKFNFKSGSLAIDGRLFFRSIT